METIGPSTGLPVDMVRPDVLLCLGEEEDEFEDALDATGLSPGPLRTHHRSFHGRVRDDILCLDGALGSPLVEKCLWELLSTDQVERIVLVGTAGAMPGFTGETSTAYRATPAMSVYQNFDAAPEATWTPSIDVGLPDQGVVSCDRFFGFSAMIEAEYPAEPGLVEAWNRLRDRDLMVDMEVAAFYHYAQAFGPPDLQYAAIKAVANRVDDLYALPRHSGQVMGLVVQEGVRALQG